MKLLLVLALLAPLSASANRTPKGDIDDDPCPVCYKGHKNSMCRPCFPYYN